MKKIILILFVFSLSLVVGCSEPIKENEIFGDASAAVENNTFTGGSSGQIDFKKLNEGNFGYGRSCIVEDGNYVYYAAQAGIYKFDKRDKKEVLLYEHKDTWALTLDGDFLYFALHYEEGDEICQIDKNGNNFSKVFNSSLIPDSDGQGIYGFLVYENKIIVNSALQAYSYNVTSKEIKCISADTEFFKIHNGYLYYIDHGQRTFTIYKKDLNIEEAKEAIVLGKGVSEPENNLYYDFEFLGEDIYYSAYRTTGEYGIYCLNNGKSYTINDWYEGRVTNIEEYDKDIYYLVDNQNDTVSIMKYDTTRKIETKIAVTEAFNHFTIVNGFLYYSTFDYKTKAIQIKN